MLHRSQSWLRDAFSFAGTGARIPRQGGANKFKSMMDPFSPLWGCWPHYLRSSARALVARFPSPLLGSVARDPCQPKKEAKPISISPRDQHPRQAALASRVVLVRARPLLSRIHGKQSYLVQDYSSSCYSSYCSSSSAASSSFFCCCCFLF